MDRQRNAAIIKGTNSCNKSFALTQTQDTGSPGKQWVIGEEAQEKMGE